MLSLITLIIDNVQKSDTCFDRRHGRHQLPIFNFPCFPLTLTLLDKLSSASLSIYLKFGRHKWLSGKQLGT